MSEEKNAELTVGLVIMASGMSKRFGENKLMTKWQGKTLIQRVLDVTDNPLFSKRVVVTRCQQVKDICDEQGIDVVIHDYPNRNDTVRLGIEKMMELDGCIFCPCDQPFLELESLEHLVEAFQDKGTGIFRLMAREKQGMPALFSKEYYQELLTLPEKCGGSYVIRKHMEVCEFVPVLHELELFDIDTKEDYEYLLSMIKEK